MPVFPCAKKSLCLDPATPFQNFTAEAPDARIFIARNTGWGPHFPPLGSDWIAVGCTVFCISTVSQEEADLCAAAGNIDCLSTVWPVTTPGFDVFGRPAAIARNRPVYRNEEQSATVNCPDGNAFTYTVPAGVFAAFSQFESNDAALSYAQQNAAEFVLCISGLAHAQICPDVAYNDSVTASSKFLDPQTICWTVFGDLPPGILTDIDDQGTCFTGSTTLNFFGTPNTPGVYNFSVQVEDGLGNFMVKAFTIRVMGIDGVDPMPDGEVGVVYQEFLTPVGVTNPIYSLEDGTTLPDGLSLDPTGVIFGTPTMAGTFNFTLGITEAGTGITCEVPASMEVNPIPCVEESVYTDLVGMFDFPDVPTHYALGDGTGPTCSGTLTLHSPAFRSWHVLITFRPAQVSGGRAWGPFGVINGSGTLNGVPWAFTFNAAGFGEYTAEFFLDTDLCQDQVITWTATTFLGNSQFGSTNNSCQVTPL